MPAWNVHIDRSFEPPGQKRQLETRRSCSCRLRGERSWENDFARSPVIPENSTGFHQARIQDKIPVLHRPVAILSKNNGATRRLCVGIL